VATQLIASIVVIVVLATGFGAYYLTSSSSISGYQNSVATLNGQLSSEQSVASLQSTQISSLQSVTASLNSANSALHSQASQLRNELNVLNESLISQMRKYGLANATIAADENEINSLAAQLKNYSAIVGMKDSRSIVPVTAFSAPFPNSPITNSVYTVGSCCNVPQPGVPPPPFAYPGFFNVTIYHTNANISSDVTLNMIYVLNGIQGGSGIVVAYNPPPNCEDCLQPPVSWLVPVIPGMTYISFQIVNFYGPSATMSLSITYQY